MFNQIGPLEIGIVLVIVLLIFGPKRLPGLGKSLGTGMREFKESITGKEGDDRDEDAPAERATLAQAPEDDATTSSPAAARDTEPADQRG
jgi:sec-independent protein translocase protein TatA